MAVVLHDHFQQILIAAQMSLNIVKSQTSDGRTLQSLGTAETFIREAIDSARTLAVELNPPVLDQGLAAALNWLASRMHQRHGLKVNVAADASAEPASADIRALLFQAVQELLLNTVKHAATDSAWVEMSSDGDTITITVRDGGLGFEVSALRTEAGASDSFGLPMLRPRLHLLGGSLEIESAPGRGTSVRMRVPMRLSSRTE